MSKDNELVVREGNYQYNIADIIAKFGTPLEIAFPFVIEKRYLDLLQTFNFHIKAHGYKGRFFYHYPMKVNQNKEFESFAPYLDDVNIDRKLDKLSRLLIDKVDFDKEKVNFMSIHKSKGLQADYVIIVGLVEGILPLKSDSIEALEAQRRIFFVGMSRVKKKLYLMSQVQWPATDAYKVDKSKFQFRMGSKIARARASSFITQLLLKK